MVNVAPRNVLRTLSEVEAEARAHDAKLTVNLPSGGYFEGCVVVHHEDRSMFMWDSAFCFKVDVYNEDGDADWLVVFTEHHGFHVFAMMDLVLYRWFPNHKPAPKAPWQATEEHQRTKISRCSYICDCERAINSPDSPDQHRPGCERSRP